MKEKMHDGFDYESTFPSSEDSNVFMQTSSPAPSSPVVSDPGERSGPGIVHSDSTSTCDPLAGQAAREI
jgi:hypothetical protein